MIYRENIKFLYRSPIVMHISNDEAQRWPIEIPVVVSKVMLNSLVG